jgi:hypothetical protein
VRENIAIRVGLVADDAGELGQGVVLVMRRALGLAEAALEVVQVHGRALSSHGLAHTLTSCGD